MTGALKKAYWDARRREFVKAIDDVVERHYGPGGISLTSKKGRPAKEWTRAALTKAKKQTIDYFKRNWLCDYWLGMSSYALLDL